MFYIQIVYFSATTHISFQIASHKLFDSQEFYTNHDLGKCLKDLENPNDYKNS